MLNNPAVTAVAEAIGMAKLCTPAAVDQDGAVPILIGVANVCDASVEPFKEFMAVEAPAKVVQDKRVPSDTSTCPFVPTVLNPVPPLAAATMPDTLVADVAVAALPAMEPLMVAEKVFDPANVCDPIVIMPPLNPSAGAKLNMPELMLAPLVVGVALIAPTFATEPVAPAGPAAPVNPCMPCAPAAPVAPVNPISPLGPGAPAAPVNPCMP